MNYKIRQRAAFCLVLCLMVLLAACSSNQSNPSDNPTSIPANAQVINIAYASSAAPWLDTAIKSFNNSGAKTADGKPIIAKGQSMGSGAMIESMVQGDSPYDMVIP